jgi:hypothetical protein
MKKTLSIQMIWRINAISVCGIVTRMDMPANPLLLSITAQKRHNALSTWMGGENIIKNLDLDFG